MTSTPINAPVPRTADGRFGPGNPGRRVGARNRVWRRVAMAILHDFEANPKAVLARLRESCTPALPDRRLPGGSLFSSARAGPSKGGAGWKRAVRKAQQRAATPHTSGAQASSSQACTSGST